MSILKNMCKKTNPSGPMPSALLKLAITVAIVVCSIMVFSAPVFAATVSVGSPSGADEWKTRTSHNITWTCSGSDSPATVDITLVNWYTHTDVQVIASNLEMDNPTNGSYTWMIPDNCGLGACLKIRVKATWPDGESFIYHTDIFSIVDPFQVITPAGGKLGRCTTQNITWSYDTNADLGDLVVVELIQSTGGRLTVLSYDVPIGSGGNGSYSWKISPYAIWSNVKIRVSSQAYYSAAAESAVFDCISPITVLSPNAGSEWPCKSIGHIEWNDMNADFGDTVSIQLLKAGAVVKTIAGNVPAGDGETDSYDWLVPDDLSPATDYQVKVISNTYPDVISAVSEEFSVSNPMAVTNPASGANWLLSSAQNITWNYNESAALGDTVKVELINQDGSTALTISSSAAIGTGGSGSYSWTAPSDLTAGTYKIKITPNENTSASASSADFTIGNPLSVTGPAGGSIFKSGETADITWNCQTGFTGTINLKLLKNGAEVSTIAASLDATAGSYSSWSVPNDLALGTDYQIQIASNEYPAIKAVSSNILINCAVSSGNVLLGYDGPASGIQTVGANGKPVIAPITLGETVFETSGSNDYILGSYHSDFYLLATDGTKPLHFEMEPLETYVDDNNATDAVVELYHLDGTDSETLPAAVFSIHIRDSVPSPDYNDDSYGDYFIPTEKGCKPGPYILKVTLLDDFDYKLRVTTTFPQAEVSFQMNGGDETSAVQTGDKGEWSQTLDLNHTTEINAQKSGYTIAPFSLDDKSDFTGDIKMYAIPNAYPELTGFVLDKATVASGETVNATIQTSGLTDGTPVYVFLLKDQENLNNVGYYFYSVKMYSGEVADNQVVIPIPISEASGSYLLRAQIEGTSKTMSKAITVSGGTTPVISSLNLSSDSGLEGRANTLSITLTTANVSDGTMAQVELTDENGELVRPLVYTKEAAISGGTAQFDLILPSTLTAGSYKLRAVVETADSLTAYADYTVYQNDMSITSFTVPDQIGDSVIDSQAHTVVFTMPYGTDISALVPAVKFNGDTILPSSGTTQNFEDANENTIKYTISTIGSDSTTVTSTQDWFVTCVEEPAPGTGTAITAFSLPGQSGAQIDTENKTITVAMPEGTSLSSLIATFTLSDGASATVNGVTQQSGVTANSFRAQVTYTVTAEDKTTAADWTVIVSCATSQFILKDGALDRTAGLTASVTALPSEGLAHEGTERVVFTLLKDGQSIQTVEVSIDIQSEEKVYAYFNVTGSEYTVRAAVVDSTDAKVLLSPVELE